MCSSIAKVFAACESLVDPTPFIDNCKYDMCMDSSGVFGQKYRCMAYAAYAFECANKGLVIDWINSSDGLREACYESGYGKCSGGSQYSECPRTYNVSCMDLASKQSMQNPESLCAPGCICSENYLFDNALSGHGSCVEQSSCSCYDKASNKYYNSNDRIKRGCGYW